MSPFLVIYAMHFGLRTGGQIPHYPKPASIFLPAATAPSVP